MLPRIAILVCCAVVACSGLQVLVGDSGETTDELEHRLRQHHTELVEAQRGGDVLGCAVSSAEILRALEKNPHLSSPEGMLQVQAIFDKCLRSVAVEFLGCLKSQNCKTKQQQKQQGLNADSIAIVTTVATEEYVLGALALSQSLKINPFVVQSKPALIALVVPASLQKGGVSEAGISWLRAVGWEVRELTEDHILRCPSEHKDVPRFSATCAKLSVFGLTEFGVILHLDADTIALSDLAPVFRVLKDNPKLDFAAVICPDFPSQPLFQTASFLLRPSTSTFLLLKLLLATTTPTEDLPFLSSLDLTHDLAVLHILFQHGWLTHKNSQLTYPTHVAQTAVTTPSQLVPRRNTGSLDLARTILFDFSGPTKFKPWRILQKLHTKKLSLFRCQGVGLIGADRHKEVFGAEQHQTLFEVRALWSAHLYAACGVVSANNLPPLEKTNRNSK